MALPAELPILFVATPHALKRRQRESGIIDDESMASTRSRSEAFRRNFATLRFATKCYVLLRFDSLTPVHLRSYPAALRLQTNPAPLVIYSSGPVATSPEPATKAGASRTAPDPQETVPHATALAPAAQPQPYVDGPAWQALCDATTLWRLLSYVRPVDAKPQLAGHDVIRLPRFSSAPRARGAGRGSEYPGLRFAGSSSPHFALANFVAVSSGFRSRRAPY